jgi:excisionase family DNA binding protein
MPGAYMPGSVDVEKLSDYMRVAEAADYLGVSPNTLRNWVNAGKIAAVRHPLNDYRLFKKKDLDSLLKKVAATSKKSNNG